MGLLCRAAVGSLGPSAAPGLLRPPAMLLGQGGAPGPPAPAGSEAAAVPRPVLSCPRPPPAEGSGTVLGGCSGGAWEMWEVFSIFSLL